MPKPIVNNIISYQNSYGRLIEFGSFLNQGVRNDDSPTFANLQITGNTTIEGNLYVEGNTTLLDSNVIAFEDNIILINRLETGSGVTLNQAGFEVERGTLENYRFVFNESDGTFKVGTLSNQQAVATRQDAPLPNGIMTWNNASKRLDSKNDISIDISFSSTTNALSSTTGSIKVSGGIGVSKDLHLDGRIYLTGSNFSNKSSIYTHATTNSLFITSPQDINLVSTTKIGIPFNTPLYFGSTSQRLVASNTSNSIDIYAAGDINFNLNFGQKITIPNQVPLTFSTANEKIYADDSNNMVVEGGQDIKFVPGPSKKILVPTNVPLAFGSSTQYVSATLLNDLNIASANNIFLTPGATLNVCLPIDSGVKFGTSGLQRIYSNSNNDLYILATNDVIISTGSRISIPSNIPLIFGSSKEYIKSNTIGNLIIDAQSGCIVNSTKGSSGVDNGALVINGGVGIAKDLHVGGDLMVYGNTVSLNTQTILVEDNIIVVNGTPLSGADGGFLVHRFSDGISATTGNVYAGLVFKEQSDEFVFAYSETAGSVTLTTTDYIPIRAGGVKVMDDTLASNFSSASLSVLGGAYLHKNLIVNHGITAASLLCNANINASSLDISEESTTGKLLVSSTANSSSTTTGCVVINGGIGVQKNIYIGGLTVLVDTTTSTSSSSGALLVHGGVSVMCSNNATSPSSGGALTIAGGASVGKNMYLGGELVSQTSASFSHMTLTSTNGDAFISHGGVRILNSTNALGVGSGGALDVQGGLSVLKDLYVGNQLFVNSFSINNTLRSPGNGIQTMINNTSPTNSWTYLGEINTSSTGYVDLTLSNGIDQDNYPSLCSIRVLASVSGTSTTFGHSFAGNTRDQVSHCYVYKSPLNVLHLFVKSPRNTKTLLNVAHQLGDPFDVEYEGTSSEPNGSSSGFTGSWVLEYTTDKEATLSNEIGNLIAQEKFKTGDNLPIVSLNTPNNAYTRDVGVLLQRYQRANDVGSGDVVNNSIKVIVDTLPNQSTASIQQIKLSNAASSANDYYNGMWIKVTSGLNNNQVRRITSYNGSLRVANLESDWTSQNPNENDTVEIYGSQNVAAFYDESENVYRLSFTSKDTHVEIDPEDDVGLQVKNITLSQSSGNAISSYGTVQINNTKDSTSTTDGGSLLTYGGASFAKTVRCGQRLVVGENTAADGDLHITKPASTIKLENESSLYSYIEFISPNKTFGIFSNSSSGQFSLTCATNGSSPITAHKALSISSSGLVGIGTTKNTSSLLTLCKNNYVSLDANDGFLGIEASSDQTNGSKVLLYGSEHATYPGSAVIQTMGTGGSLKIKNGNVDILQTSNISTTIYTTTVAINSTSGSIVSYGGVAIAQTSNASSSTNGGSLTVAGGAAIMKDMYIGGNAYVSGTLTAAGFSSNPSLTFSNTSGCSIVSFGNNKLLKLNDESFLTFYVDVLPSAESQNCQFTFTLPERTTNLTNRGDVIISLFGYTDDTNLYSLFNLLGVGVTGSTSALIKFQSASTGLHKLLVSCRYTNN